MKVEYIDHLGTDLTCVNAARVSFDKESEWAEGYHTADKTKGILSYKDQRLIHYLASHGHFSPFTHPQITLRYTVPIFVARQEFKHIVGFTRNEVSRRYVDEEPEFFTPKAWRSRPEGSVKQGSGEETVEEIEMYGYSQPVEDAYRALLVQAEDTYRGMIKAGVAPELARMCLPQSMMTSYYITGSLASFARFYKQRVDSHAQVEIQELAHQVGDIIAPLFPCSWKALTE